MTKKVNALAPGSMVTDNTAPLRADEKRSASIFSRIPAGQWGTPDDLKGAAVLPASDAARYLHGAIVPGMVDPLTGRVDSQVK